MKNWKRLLAFSLLSLLFLNLLVAFVIAQTSGTTTTTTSTSGGTTTIVHSVSSKISDFGSAFDESTKILWSHILLGILTFMLIYNVIGFTGLVKPNSFSAFAVSAIVSVLGSMWLSVADIKALVKGNEALLIAITSILPLLILITFSIRMATGGGVAGGPTKPALNWIARVMVLIYAIWSAIQYFALAGEGNKLAITYLIVGLIALLWFIFEKPIIKRMLGDYVNDKIDAYKRKRAAAREAVDENARDVVGPEAGAFEPAPRA